MIALLPELKARGARTALDLGCGVGWHALLLAEHGLAVEAIDGSAAGLAVVREAAQARGISLGVRQGTADALPFDDGSFDFVLSWNVIHHGSLGDVGRRLAEIWRVLKPKALFQGTMLPTRNINYGRGRTVAPDTFVRDRAEERGHPHFYCDAATLGCAICRLRAAFSEAATAAQAGFRGLAHHRRTPAAVKAQRYHIHNTIGVYCYGLIMARGGLGIPT